MSASREFLDIPDHAVEAAFAAFWEGTRRREFLIQRCSLCGRAQHYPRALCTHCGATDGLSMVPASGKGHVYSFTEVQRAPHPDLAAPYTIALVALEEGPQVLSRVVGAPAREVSCDAPVTLDWVGLDDGRALAVFRLAAPASS